MLAKISDETKEMIEELDNAGLSYADIDDASGVSILAVNIYMCLSGYINSKTVKPFRV